MGFYINMEMPKDCWECAVQVNPICIEFVDFGTRGKRPEQCPLIEVPDGRLINAEELEQEIHKRFLICEKDGNHFQKPYEALRAIESAPTVIPYSKDGET